MKIICIICGYKFSMICNQNNTVTIVVNKIIQALQTVTKLTEICLNNFRHLNHMPVTRMYFIKRAFMLLTNRLCDTLIAAKENKWALLIKHLQSKCLQTKTWQKPQLNDWHLLWNLLWVKKKYNGFCYVSWARLVKWEFSNSNAFYIHSPQQRVKIP